VPAGRRRLCGGGLLEQLIVQDQVGHEPLEAGVLGLQFPQPFGVVSLEAAVAGLPAVVGLLADAELLADLGQGRP